MQLVQAWNDKSQILNNLNLKKVHTTKQFHAILKDMYKSCNSYKTKTIYEKKIKTNYKNSNKSNKTKFANFLFYVIGNTCIAVQNLQVLPFA